MNTVKLTGVVDEHHRLTVDVPPNVAPGPVEVIVLLPSPSEDENDQSWAQGIAALWAADWNDPREDIYTLEDGKPVDDPR